MVVNSLIKTFSLCVRLALPTLVASAAFGPQTPAVLPQPAEHRARCRWPIGTHCLSGYENRAETFTDRELLRISVFSFNLWRLTHALLTVYDVPTAGFSVAGRVSGSSISQMRLSDTGYLSLWFWMNSAWCTAAAPAALSQLPSLPVTKYPTFLFLTSCGSPDHYLSGSP